MNIQTSVQSATQTEQLNWWEKDEEFEHEKTSSAFKLFLKLFKKPDVTIQKNIKF